MAPPIVTPASARWPTCAWRQNHAIVRKALSVKWLSRKPLRISDLQIMDRIDEYIFLVAVKASPA